MDTGKSICISKWHREQFVNIIVFVVSYDVWLSPFQLSTEDQIPGLEAIRVLYNEL